MTILDERVINPYDKETERFFDHIPPSVPLNPRTFTRHSTDYGTKNTDLRYPEKTMLDRGYQMLSSGTGVSAQT